MRIGGLGQDNGSPIPSKVDEPDGWAAQLSVLHPTFSDSLSLNHSQPYASNPSFRPPVPLSNDVQDQINRDLLRWDQDLGSLSEKYGVSKARIHAIRKLKEVEAEFVRQVSETYLACPVLLPTDFYDV